MKINVEQYIKENGTCPFEKWFNKLNSIAAAKISTALYRMELGNFSNVKSLGDGVFENKIHFGPGYRIYFGQEGDELVILLGGGTKSQQSKDIQEAKALWNEYKTKKR